MAPFNLSTKLRGTIGGSYSDASAVNARGDVVGFSYPTGDATFHATLWHT